MKKIGIRVSFVLFLLLLAACSSSNETELENALSEVDLTNREKFLLSSTSDHFVVFDFQADKKYKQISVWVDQYEFGKLVGQKLNHITMEIEETGTLIFAKSKQLGDEGNITFNISVESNHASGGTSTTQKVVTTNQSTWGSNPLEEIPINGSIILATMSSSNGNGMSSLSSEFYTDLDSRIGEIADYDVVYVLKSEFLE